MQCFIAHFFIIIYNIIDFKSRRVYMKKIGIITAMTEEFDSIKELMNEIKEDNYYSLRIIFRNNKQ